MMDTIRFNSVLADQVLQVDGENIMRETSPLRKDYSDELLIGKIFIPATSVDFAGNQSHMKVTDVPCVHQQSAPHTKVINNSGDVLDLNIDTNTTFQLSLDDTQMKNMSFKRRSLSNRNMYRCVLVR